MVGLDVEKLTHQAEASLSNLLSENLNHFGSVDMKIECGRLLKFEDEM
jgi:hypothetical protein